MKKSLSGTSFAKTLSGLTLIELIFVVTLIAILLALLMPGLKAAREQVRAVQCLNNVKQIGHAQLMFADEHDGKFVRFRDTSLPTPDELMCPELPSNHYWHVCLAKYLAGSWGSFNTLETFTGKNEIGICPSNRNGERWDLAYWGPWPNPSIMFGYAMNYHLMVTSTGGVDLSISRKIFEVNRPTIKPMFGCSYIGPEFAGIGADKTSLYSYIHRGASNFVFVDGHAERKTQAELNAILPFTDGWKIPDD